MPRTKEPTIHARQALFYRIWELAEQYSLALESVCKYMATAHEFTVLERRGWFTDWHALRPLTTVGRELSIGAQRVLDIEESALLRISERMGRYHYHVKQARCIGERSTPTRRRRVKNPQNSPQRARPRRELRVTLEAEVAPRPAAKPGMIGCLRCDRTFQSWDVRTNRLCSRCRPRD